MNVFYKGVDNPIEVSVPGVAPENLIVSGPGISGRAGNYVANVNNLSGEVTISVSVKEKDGKTRKAGSKIFRIKSPPSAVGSIFQKKGGPINASLLVKGTIDAKMENFPFDLPLTVTNFTLSIPGSLSESHGGSKIPNKLRDKILDLKPGSTVAISDIVAKTPSGTRVDVGSLVFKIN
jgi:hypothetical protein